jgi:S-adenosyl-L-methionine hydrolase (adenosine-forming)
MIITLTTDFGQRDSFVGAMKGVILGIAPGVRIVDLAHEINGGDIRAAAFALMTAAPFFPAGTIHLVIVDPGVGSARRAIAIRCNQATFLGPDNGVLSWAIKDKGSLEVRSLQNPAIRLPRLSATFHGRDLFAPAAAWLAQGRPFAEIGPELNDFHRLDWPKATPVAGGWQTEIIYVDVYGNAITALSGDQAAERQSVILPGERRVSIEPFYSAVSRGSPLAVVGSSGLLEIAIHGGDAAKTFNLRPGTQVLVA